MLRVSVSGHHLRNDGSLARCGAVSTFQSDVNMKPPGRAPVHSIPSTGTATRDFQSDPFVTRHDSSSSLRINGCTKRNRIC